MSGLRLVLIAILTLGSALIFPASALAAPAWNYLVTDAVGNTHYWRPAGRSLETPAWVHIEHRVDLASPLTAAGMTYRSMLYRVEFDCAAHRYREIGLTGYVQSGLTGQAVVAPPRSDWYGSQGNAVPSVLEPAACWRYLITNTYGDVIKVLTPYPSVADPRHRTISTMSDYPANVDLAGLSVRSTIMDLEVDCTTFSTLGIRMELFGGPSGTGQRWTAPPETAWRPTPVGSSNRATAEAACR